MVMQLACASLLATSTFVATSTQAGTLEDVQARAAFGCVVRTSGEWHGFNFCSATAPAVFGDPKAIKAGTSMRVGPKAGTEFNLADYFHANDMKYEAVTIETNDTIGIDPEYHAILPEIIPKESPATHQIEGRSCEDPVVLDEKILKAPSRPPIRQGNQGAELGSRADWAYNVLKSVGTYRDIFERNIRESEGGPDGSVLFDSTRADKPWHPLPPPRPPFL